MRKRARAMRWQPIAGVVLVAVLVASCSNGGSSSSKSSKTSGKSPSACALVAKLDEIANTVAQADVHNPDTFKKTMNAAVRDYVTNVRTLEGVAPADLRAGLVRVEADVQQLRFDAALTDRAGLDAYAARTCGRALQPLTATTGSTAGSVAESTTTIAGASTTTTSIATG